MLVSAVQQKWVSYMYVMSAPSWACLPPSPSQPSGPSQSESWAPCAAQQLPLAVCLTSEPMYISATLFIPSTLLEKWFWWAYLQGKHRDTDVDSGLVDAAGEGESGKDGESSVSICTLSAIRCIAGEKLPCSGVSPVWYSVMTWRGGVEGGEGG